MLDNSYETLAKAIEEEEKALAAGNGEPEPEEEEEADVEAPEAEIDEEQGAEEEQVAAPAAKPEPKAEEKKPEPVAVAKPEEPKPDGQAFARMRWEAAEAKRKLEETERKAKELEDRLNGKSTALSQEVDPAKLLASELAEMREWRKQREAEEAKARNEREAVQAFSELENQFKATVNDYDEAAAHVVQTLTNSIRVLNPGATQEQINAMARQHILSQGAQAAQQGINPAQALYHAAYHTYGYTPQPKEVVNNTTTVRKPDMAKVAANRQKSAGLAAAAGVGAGHQVGPKDVMNMTQAEIAKLTEADWKRLEEEARSLEG